LQTISYNLLISSNFSGFPENGGTLKFELTLRTPDRNDGVLHWYRSLKAVAQTVSLDSCLMIV
jgi:hypothetical protein